MGNNWKDTLRVTRAQLLLAIGAGHIKYPTFFLVSDAVSGTYEIEVTCDSSGITGSADDYNLTLTETGTYDINADTWTAASGGSSTADHLEIEFVATEDVFAFVPVTSTGRIADSTLSIHRNKVIGICKADVLTGFVGIAVGFGQITNVLWSWTIGDRIYLNGNALSTTAVSTGFSVQIGTATASDTIDVNIQPSILL